MTQLPRAGTWSLLVCTAVMALLLYSWDLLVAPHIVWNGNHYVPDAIGTITTTSRSSFWDYSDNAPASLLDPDAFPATAPAHQLWRTPDAQGESANHTWASEFRHQPSDPSTT